MTTWVIISWVVVAILTGINIYVFFKLKNASEKMMKMAFPNAKNMHDALSQMESMMKAAKRGVKRGRGPVPVVPGGFDAQLKAALDTLKRTKR